MKIAAICDRGTKRDFIDLYLIVKQKFSLSKALGFTITNTKIVKQCLPYNTKSPILQGCRQRAGDAADDRENFMGRSKNSSP